MYDVSYGVYAKDNLQLGRRTTLNLGVRFDRYHMFNKEENEPVGPFTAGGTFPKQDVLTMMRVVPRLGIAHDLTGSGRTVLRASFGQYGYDPQATYALNHSAAALLTTTYSWNGPCVVTPYNVCDAAPATLANLRPSSPNFVTAAGGVTLTTNPNLKQQYIDTATAGVEHELVRNLAVRTMYVYNRNVNAYSQVNLRRPYEAFTIPVPRADPLTGTIITLYTYPASLAGSAFVLNQYQNETHGPDTYHAVEFTATKRKSNRWTGLASFSVTKNHRWLTPISQSPNNDLFPIDQTWDRFFKASGTYDLPYDINLGGIFTYVLGTANRRTVQFTGVPQLGTVVVPVEEIGAQRPPSVNMLNLRAGRTFRMRGSKSLELSMDVFNLLNTNAAITVSYQTGPTYGVVSAITPPLVARLNASYRF